MAKATPDSTPVCFVKGPTKCSRPTNVPARDNPYRLGVSGTRVDIIRKRSRLKAVVDHALDFFHFLMPISEIARASSDTSTSFSSLSSSALYKTSLVL
jgi:hypothetical protein